MFKLNYFSCNWLVLKIHNSKVTKYLNIIKGRVYDFGCGTKPYRDDILIVADEYIGVDWSNSPHEMTADIIADLNKPLEIGSEQADTIVSFQVMEHLREPHIMLSEAHRILKNGGNLFLTVPFQWLIHEAPYDYCRYTRYGLEYLLEKAGFEDVHIEPHGGFFTMWLLKLNYFSFRFVRGPKPLKILLSILCLPFWLSGQIIAPILDFLDRSMNVETTGYTVIAKKK